MIKAIKRLFFSALTALARQAAKRANTIVDSVYLKSQDGTEVPLKEFITTGVVRILTVAFLGAMA